MQPFCWASGASRSRDLVNRAVPKQICADGQLKQVGDGDASGSGKRAKLRNSTRVKRDTFRDRGLGFVVVRTEK